jgi:hypothetical protein
MDQWSLVVRATFLTIDEPVAVRSQRRSSSTPLLLRSKEHRELLASPLHAAEALVREIRQRVCAAKTKLPVREDLVLREFSRTARRARWRHLGEERAHSGQLRLRALLPRKLFFEVYFAACWSWTAPLARVGAIFCRRLDIDSVELWAPERVPRQKSGMRFFFSLVRKTSAHRDPSQAMCDSAMRQLLTAAIHTLQLTAAGLLQLVAPDGQSLTISIAAEATLKDLYALVPPHWHVAAGYGVSHLGRLLTVGLPLKSFGVGPGSCLRIVQL